LDGGLLYTSALSINTGTVARILIGYYNNYNNNCTSNNVALFNKALTAAEVRDLYLNGLYIKEDDAYCLNTNQFNPWFVRPSSVWD
jgi:hypothetical protein